MQTIITRPAQAAHASPDTLARQRADRLARATTDQMEAALAYLSMIDPEAFGIAFSAVTPADDQPEDDEPIPLCGACQAPIALFLDRGLEWLHFRGDAATTGAHEIYDPGHLAKVAWYLPGETPEDF